MPDQTPPELSPEQRASRTARDQLQQLWYALAEQSEQDALAKASVVPSVHDVIDLLLEDAEAECRRLNRMLVRMEDADRDVKPMIDLVEIVTRATVTIRTLRDQLPPEA